MSSVNIGDRALSSFADGELIAWFNEHGQNRLRAETARLYLAVLRAFDDVGPPMSVRQVFYALESRGVIPKTQRAYDRMGYHLLQMRRRGILGYDFIADSTRWRRKPTTYSNLGAFLEHGRKAYRRAVWDNQPAYVEVWVEKDALAGVLYAVTEPWDVPLHVTRGFPSESFVYEAAQTLRAVKKPCFIYYFGDYDPSGRSIAESTERKLREFGARFEFSLVAVQPWQIEHYHLRTRPAKGTDSRAKSWTGGGCVELDALPADVLRRMVEQRITMHIDRAEYERLQQAERLERQSFETVIKNLGHA